VASAYGNETQNNRKHNNLLPYTEAHKTQTITRKLVGLLLTKTDITSTVKKNMQKNLNLNQ